jgi:photosynthetic reaction center cytochrome c subunit
MMTLVIRIAVVLGVLAVAGVIGTTFSMPPVETVQRGYRGTGMVELYNPKTLEALYAANQIPETLPPSDASGTKARDAYQNVKVLGDVDVVEFTRLMATMTTWVSPDQGCDYCHNTDNMASDEHYTKVVARRMLQMVQHINADWKDHVAGTGVTCYTCHRGNPVPVNIWHNDPGPPVPGNTGQTGKNLAATTVGLTSLPFDPFTPFLEQANDIRIASNTALPDGSLKSIKQTEWTYGLMMHFSTALGVNCTYCHNSRSFTDWDQSTPQRMTAWYGIRMVRDLNTAYLDPLQGVFPHERLGPTGDAPKLNCLTCHNGVYKPLFGVSMIKDFPELATISH